MGYYINLESIPIDSYFNKLKVAYLPPSRTILRERSEDRCAHFKGIGLKNVKELLQILKKKDKFTELSNQECFSGEYLTILLRELNSTLPKPNKLRDFTGISDAAITRLEKMGVKDTLKLYPHITDAAKRQELANKSGISYPEILELTKLTDLSRIKWVGATFARMLVDLGYDSVEKASKADPIVLHQQINQISKEKAIYKGQIGLNDIRIFVEAAKDVPLEIEY
jgi:hypothetical protein